MSGESLETLESHCLQFELLVVVVTIYWHQNVDFY